MASATSPGRLVDFTPTTHETVPNYLSPYLTKLPQHFAVCVIGASRGIGEEIAYAYANAGAGGIMLAARSMDALNGVANKVEATKPDCSVYVENCDITSSDSVSELAKLTVAKLGRLDALVVNSGYSGDVILDVTKTPPESFRTASEVNYLGTFHAAHHFLPLLMNSDNGAKHFIVVGTIGVAIVRGIIANAQYCISKAAQMKLVEHIHEQFADKGLLAVCVHPGAVLTEMALTSKGAEQFVKDTCKDSVALCGAFCVWLARERDRQSWLGGRLLSATWDVKELEQRRDEMVDKDLLKLIVTT